MNENLLQGLNEPQRQAVTSVNGPVMVIAGAGSGKTRVLTYRMAWLMAHHQVDPFRILALTFTNKAAREMKNRIGQLLGDTAARSLWMGTFHSVFARLLRAEAHLLGYQSNFTIYDQEDSGKVILQTIKDLNLDKEIYKPKQVQSRISALKNALITPNLYQQDDELVQADASARMPEFYSLYNAYVERCYRSGAMDFDDLLLNTYILLDSSAETLAKYQRRFQYILVDEYQDTNQVQYRIVKKLADQHGNICVVGDDAQSIYAFRGANIANILNFQADFALPGAPVKVFKLEQNYRSSDTIVKAANSVIKNNKKQLDKKVWTANPEGEKIAVYRALTDVEEGTFIAQTIFEQSMREQWHFGHFAVLYRTNAQSRNIEDALRRKGIPYRIYGGLSFYQRKEIKDVLAYLRLAINPLDEEALKRVINYPIRGIGQTSVDRLLATAYEQRRAVWEIVENPEFYPTGLNKPTLQKVLDFAAAIKSYIHMAQTHDAFEVATHVLKSTGIFRTLGDDKTPEGVSRLQNLEELVNAIKDFCDRQKQVDGADSKLETFLADVALMTDADQSDSDDHLKVSLMTIHLAKGLEFPAVFIAGLEEELFPSMMAMNSRDDLEEERRLFYVALTRAEKKAFLSWAETRFRWGKLTDGEPSRFLEELDPQFLDLRLAAPPKTKPEILGFKPTRGFEPRPAKSPSVPPPSPSTPLRPPTGFKPVQAQRQAPQPAANPGETTHLEPGTRVRHDRFGTGILLGIEGTGDQCKATVHFDVGGEKKLLLKFARLEVLPKS
jgi:DNA helicase-2/ATP-dependent DNA helicase PcrA